MLNVRKVLTLVILIEIFIINTFLKKLNHYHFHYPLASGLKHFLIARAMLLLFNLSTKFYQYHANPASQLKSQ